ELLVRRVDDVECLPRDALDETSADQHLLAEEFAQLSPATVTRSRRRILLRTNGYKAIPRYSFWQGRQGWQGRQMSCRGRGVSADVVRWPRSRQARKRGRPTG